MTWVGVRRFNNIFFMFKKKAHVLSMTHKAFVEFLVLWASLMCDFLVMWTFLALAHVG